MVDKSKYFKIGEAIDDVKYADGVKDMSIASIKALGKGIFNIGRFAVAEVIPSVLDNAAKAAESRKNNK